MGTNTDNMQCLVSCQHISIGSLTYVGTTYTRANGRDTYIHTLMRTFIL